MKTKLLNAWERLRSSYWFLPLLMVAGSIGLAFVSITLDQSIQVEYDAGDELSRWLYAGDLEGARALLSTVAGSMITVVSVTFSITMVALSQASAQFGSLLLKSFMRDRANQLSLGAFVSTFMYCLLVLRTVRGLGNGDFIPHLSVGLAVLLALASVGVLIFFIHHVSASLQAEQIVASLGRDLNKAIRRLFPEKNGLPSAERKLRHEGDLPERFEQESRPIAAPNSGYLQAINYEGLVGVAAERDLLLGVSSRPGDFVLQGGEIARAWPADGHDDELCGKIGREIVLGTQRLQRQDVELAVNQLVEIAVRALSPGINDPFTAMACVDQLGESLAYLAERTIPSGYYYDADGKLRLVARVFTFAGIMDAAFNQIRQYGRTSVAVSVRLLETITLIAGRARDGEPRAALLGQAEAIRRGAMEALPDEGDRRDVEQRYRQLRELLARV